MIDPTAFLNIMLKLVLICVVYPAYFWFPNTKWVTPEIQRGEFSKADIFVMYWILLWFIVEVFSFAQFWINQAKAIHFGG